MKKRLLAMVLILVAMLAVGTTVVLGDPGGSKNPPIELDPTSIPITFPIGGDLEI